MGREERQKRVALREVAERAGVSLGTASSVFTGKSWVSPETHMAVQKAAQELGYKPRVGGQANTKSAQVMTLGLVVRGMDLPLPINPFYANILHGAEQECREKEIALMYAIIDEQLAHFDDLPVMVQRKQVDGLLVVGYVAPEFFTCLQSLHLPFVLIDHDVETLHTDFVNPDDERGGYLATRYLLERGHRPPAIIAGPLKHVSVQKRLKGFHRALAEYGISPDQSYIRIGNHDTASGMQEMFALLDMKQPPTAVFCCNDLMALGALDALRARNIAVPAQCAIIGYDDIDMAARTIPTLTTIRTEKELLGKQGVWHLLERINDPELAPRRTLIDVKLIERESV